MDKKVYKRGNIWWIRYYRQGKQYRESAHTAKETEARRLLKLREGEIAQGKPPMVYFDRVTFDELAKGYLSDYNINQKKSIAAAQCRVKNLSGFFSGYRVTNITTSKIEKYIEERLEGGAANGTINRELSALRRMFTIAEHTTPPKVATVPYFPRLKEARPRDGFFEHSDYLLIQEHLPDYLKGIATFAYKTGCRKSEILSLRWANIDFHNGVIRLKSGETKNDEPRIIYMDKELTSTIQAQWNKRKEIGKLTPYVFPNKEGTDKITNTSKAWNTACKKAGIGKKLLHDFRRTTVRNLVRAGVPERVAMSISGHKTRSVFERYNIVSETDLQIAAQKQEKYLEAQAEKNKIY